MDEGSGDRERARELVARLVEQHPREFLEEVQLALRRELKRSRGRPKGKAGVDDSSRLERVIELRASGVAVDDEDAIRMAAEEDPGASARETRRRLRRKLLAFRAETEKSHERAARKEVIDRAFAEDVETWDL